MMESNYGWVGIDYWEYVVLIVYLVVLYTFFARKMNLMRKERPEYRYFVMGMFAKVIGATFFALAYFYWFPGGDTLSYFYSSVPLAKLILHDPVACIGAWLGENTIESRSVFTAATGRPYMYIYLDDRQYMVVRMVAPFTFICLNSYLITTVVFSTFSFFGIWRLYQTFYRYWPRLHKEMAIAVLFMPSCVVWASAIMKDTITFCAFCYVVSALDDLWFRKVNQVSAVFTLLIGCTVIIWVKAYIFMCLFPVLLTWLSYERVSRIRNSAIRYITLPLVLILLTGGAMLVLSKFGSLFGQFSMDNALEGIVAVQRDLAYSEEYGTNSFDVGYLEPTWPSILSKYPVATSAALFRPFLTECTNFMMVLSGLENLVVLLLFVRLMLRTRVVFFFSIAARNPLILICFLFTFLYGFVTGITTPNFGALVRFKIPLMPLFIGGMFMVNFLVDERKRLQSKGLTFRAKDYRRGDPYVQRGPDGMPLPAHRIK